MPSAPASSPSVLAASNANVARFLPERAQAEPTRLAVRLPQRDRRGLRFADTSFAELETLSNALALDLEARGLRRGMRTLLLVRPGLELIGLTFALFKLGAVPVVIDPGMGRKHFLACVRRSGPEALVGIPAVHLLSRLFPSAFRSVRHRYRVGRLPAASAVVPVLARTAPDELAAILFTSGSTGAPKGVCYTHGMFDAQVRLLQAAFAIAPGEVDLPMLPVFALFNPALGATTVVPEMDPRRPAQADPARLVEVIQAAQVTTSFGSPALWERVCTWCESHPQPLPSLRRILMAGAPVPPGLLQRLQPFLPHAEIFSPYGATECLPVTVISAREVLAETAAQTTQGAGTCVGKALPGVRVRIIAAVDAPLADWSQAREMPLGSIGEIVVTGPTVTRSYDRLPEATARAKIVDAEGTVWHRMGDAGYLDASGRLWFCGRLAERVLTPAGVRYTDPVEGVFNACPGVRRSALIGLGTPGQERPAVVIEPRPDQVPPTLDQLQAWARQHTVTADLDTFFFCEAFPVDVRHNAKIHRLTLRERYNRLSR